jgi:hypothetical protein
MSLVSFSVRAIAAVDSNLFRVWGRAPDYTARRLLEERPHMTASGTTPRGNTAMARRSLQDWTSPAEGSSMMNIDDIRDKLASRFHEGLLRRTYDSVRSRLTPDGYFPESLTGAYAGMFPRTAASLVRILADTGEPDLAERNIHYCIQGMLDNGMERIPHVIGERNAAGPIPLLCDEDEVDGQAHVIMAWAELAAARGRTPYEDLSYAIVAELLDRATSPPYYLPESTGGRVLPGLIRNLSLEHSRDDHFWDTYDFLTQSFVASALEKMSVVATRRGDTQHAERWPRTLTRLSANIDANMTREFEGKRIYFEMLLPGQHAYSAFPGMGWINLAPIPADWQGVDATIFNDTIETWRRVARIEWNGPSVPSCDWLPEGTTDRRGRQHSHQVIGKALGWDMLHAMGGEQFDYVASCLDFMEQVNAHALFAEAFCYDQDTATWKLNDPGNGEQACWWVWCMMRIRRQAGLPLLPKQEAGSQTA